MAPRAETISLSGLLLNPNGLYVSSSHFEFGNREFDIGM